MINLKKKLIPLTIALFFLQSTKVSQTIRLNVERA